MCCKRICLSCSSQPISGVMTFDFLRAPAFCSVAFELINLMCLIKYFKEMKFGVKAAAVKPSGLSF